MKLFGFLALFLSAFAYGATVEVSQGLQSLNALTSSTQIFSATQSGSAFSVSSTGSTHTFSYPTDVPFFRTCTLTSAAAVTPVTCLADADVPAGKKVYLSYWHIKVNGATGWGTTATCTITDSTPTTFVTVAIAALTNAAFVQAATANVTLASPFTLGTGGGTAKGLQVQCNANGTGSDLVFVLSGVIR